MREVREIEKSRQSPAEAERSEKRMQEAAEEKRGVRKSKAKCREVIQHNQHSR